MKRGRSSSDVAAERKHAVVPLVIAYVAKRERFVIADALASRAEVRFAESFSEVRQQLAAGLSPWVVLIPAREATGALAAGQVRHIARSCPQTAIVASCQPSIEYSADIRALVVAGVHEFLFAGVDNTGVALRAVIERAARGASADVVLNTIRDLLPERVRDFVTCCVTRPEVARTVGDTASLLGLHRKTLFNQCRGMASGFGPEELISWCRVLLASYLLQSPGRTVESIALELEFPSATALRNLLKSYTKMSATELRAAGGLNPAAARLRARLGIQPLDRRDVLA